MPITPEERDITLTQLWERDYMFLDTMNKATADFKEELNQTVTRLHDVFDQKIKEAISTIDFLKGKIQEGQDDAKKMFEQKANDLNTQVVKSIQAYEDKVTFLLNNFRQDVNQKVEDDIQKSYEEIFRGISDISKNVTKYKDEVSEQVNKTQLDLSTKLGQVVSMFNDSKQKFKKISEQLQG